MSKLFVSFGAAINSMCCMRRSVCMPGGCRIAEAAAVLQVCRSVLALEPAHAKANFKAGSALRQLRREPEALMHYRRHLKHFPADEQAQFWVSVLSGDAVAHAPAAHVASVRTFSFARAIQYEHYDCWSEADCCVFRSGRMYASVMLLQLLRSHAKAVCLAVYNLLCPL